MNPFTVPAALRAAGAAIHATDLVINGEVRHCILQRAPTGPPRRARRSNGVLFFQQRGGGHSPCADVNTALQRVAVIDFDVHHGNGTEDIFQGDERVLMCSIFEKGLYPFNGEKALGPNMCNVGLPSRSGGDKFREAVTNEWLPALNAFKPEMIFISAGFDAHREDDMGNLGFVEADYAWVTQQLMAVAKVHSKGRVVSCLEGGYVMSPLAAAWQHTSKYSSGPTDRQQI
jgi:acetoin utilization deacetylase AcuC-like enzyme